jgi:hypothetical protein
MMLATVDNNSIRVYLIRKRLHMMTYSIVLGYHFNSGIDYIDLDSGFGATSLFMKFSKSGLNHLSDCISFHCSSNVLAEILFIPYLDFRIFFSCFG